jgi:RimJ/RimL family protein N-acetyltransferase
MIYGHITTEAKMRYWVRALLKRYRQGTDLPFTAIHVESDKPIGCTRAMEMNPTHRTVEIGGTWLGVDYWRTGVNVECRYLILRHASEVIGCIRLQIRTDIRNARNQNQKSLEYAIGAMREGVLRNQLIRPDGTKRDSAIYSIIDTDWPHVKSNLERKLGIASPRESGG